MTGNQNHDWSPGVTHVVAAHMPRRNQKCLAALASGAWLVAPTWVDACVAEGRLVPEVRVGTGCVCWGGEGAAVNSAGGRVCSAATTIGGGDCLMQRQMPVHQASAIVRAVITLCPSSGCVACPSLLAACPAWPQEQHELSAGSAEVEAHVAKHWRLAAVGGGGGAFQGLRVLVAASLGEPFRRDDIAWVLLRPLALLYAATF